MNEEIIDIKLLDVLVSSDMEIIYDVTLDMALDGYAGEEIL